VFQGLSPSTYTVITKDSANNTLSNQVVIITLGQNSNYTIGVVLDNIVNLSPGSQMASWHVNITPPLPFGTSISFLLPVNTIKAYYLPGTGTINDTTVVKKNNTTLGIFGQSSTPLVSAPRAFCSPYTSGTTTTTTLYSVTMGYGDVVSGTSISDLVITNGQVGSNSCVTKLEQSILINTVSPTITGGACNSVTNNPSPQGISYHSISNTVVTPTLPMAVTYVKTNACARVIGNITKQGYSTPLFTINAGDPVLTTSTTLIVNVGDVLIFDFTTLPLTPSCVGIPLFYDEMNFTLDRNGVNVYTQDIFEPAINGGSNSLYYTYTVPAGTTSLTVDITGTVS
jgi:hypothetical protein